MNQENFHPQVSAALQIYSKIAEDRHLAELITSQQWDRIISRSLGGIVNPVFREPANGLTPVQFHWNRFYTNSKDLQLSLSQAIGANIHTAIEMRGQPIGSEIAHIDAFIQNQPQENVSALSQDELTAIRKKLVPLLGKVAILIANGDLDAREIAANAMAVGTLSNRTPFRIDCLQVLPYTSAEEEHDHNIDPIWETAALKDAIRLQEVAATSPVSLKYPQLNREPRRPGM